MPRAPTRRRERRLLDRPWKLTWRPMPGFRARFSKEKAPDSRPCHDGSNRATAGLLWELRSGFRLRWACTRAGRPSCDGGTIGSMRCGHHRWPVRICRPSCSEKARSRRRARATCCRVLERIALSRSRCGLSIRFPSHLPQGLLNRDQASRSPRRRRQDQSERGRKLLRRFVLSRHQSGRPSCRAARRPPRQRLPRQSRPSRPVHRPARLWRNQA